MEKDNIASTEHHFISERKPSMMRSIPNIVLHMRTDYTRPDFYCFLHPIQYIMNDGRSQ